MPDSRDKQNILLRRVLSDSVISCKRVDILVDLRSMPISKMEETVNTLSTLVGNMGVIKEVYD